MVLKLENNNSTLVFGKANSAGEELIQILRVRGNEASVGRLLKRNC